MDFKKEVLAGKSVRELVIGEELGGLVSLETIKKELVDPWLAGDHSAADKIRKILSIWKESIMSDIGSMDFEDAEESYDDLDRLIRAMQYFKPTEEEVKEITFHLEQALIDSESIEEYLKGDM